MKRIIVIILLAICNIGYADKWEWNFYEGTQNGSDYIIEIIFDQDRNIYGELRLYHPSGYLLYGPVQVLGRSDELISSSHGNSERNPIMQYGDTPTGVYNSYLKSSLDIFPTYGIPYSEVISASGMKTFGSQGLVVLDAVSGDALKAKEQSNRFGLMIHAGDLYNEQLRPTSGCVRMFPRDMANMFYMLIALSEFYNYNGKVEIINGVVDIKVRNDVKYSDDNIPDNQSNDKYQNHPDQDIKEEVKECVNYCISLIQDLDCDYYKEFVSPESNIETLYDYGKSYGSSMYDYHGSPNAGYLNKVYTGKDRKNKNNNAQGNNNDSGWDNSTKTNSENNEINDNDDYHIPPPLEIYG